MAETLAEAGGGKGRLRLRANRVRHARDAGLALLARRVCHTGCAIRISAASDANAADFVHDKAPVSLTVDEPGYLVSPSFAGAWERGRCPPEGSQCARPPEDVRDRLRARASGGLRAALPCPHTLGVTIAQMSRTDMGLVESVRIDDKKYVYHFHQIRRRRRCLTLRRSLRRLNVSGGARRPLCS